MLWSIVLCGSYITVMLKEIQKAFDVRILDVIGNGKKRYSQIQSALGTQNNGLLDKQLKNLINMETIQKTFPINKEDDKRKHFYEIRDNLMRFYFSYVFANSAPLARLGERAFFENEIAESLVHFVSRRLERIAQDYFSRQVKAGKLKGVTNIGSYWYDDPATRTNGEFDCVVMRRGALDVYECKYYEQPMRMDECELEQRQVRRIPELPIGRVGFVCTTGFDFDSSDFDLISGEDLYRLRCAVIDPCAKVAAIYRRASRARWRPRCGASPSRVRNRSPRPRCSAVRFCVLRPC